MRVSFVVTVFNKVPYLPHVWAGLLAQQRSPEVEHEYVFVDDGSTDGSADLLARLTAGHPNVTILAQPNAGPAMTLNRGIAAATGGFVKLLDSDDVLLPWATCGLLGALAETGAEAAFAPFPQQLRYGVTEGVAPLLATPRPDLPRARLVDLLPVSLRRAQATPSLWLVRRDALLAAGCSDPGVFVQDYSLELRLAARGPIAVLDAPVVAYPDAAPGRLSDAHAQVLHDVNAALARFLADHPSLPPALRRAALRRAAGRAWLFASRHGPAEEALRALMLHLLALAGALPGRWQGEEALCRAFRHGPPIRRPLVAAG